MLRLFSALASDFYRPQYLGDLHSKLFPWKHYHPIRSADSIHQALKRLREHFHQSGIPIFISENKGHYTLNTESPLCLQVTAQEISTEKTYAPLLNSLISKFNGQHFSAPIAAQHLKLSRNMILNYLRHWQNSGLVSKISGGPYTKYKINPELDPYNSEMN